MTILFCFVPSDVGIRGYVLLYYSPWAGYNPPPPPPRNAWDLIYFEKWMPPSPNWDGLPVGCHFQNGCHQHLHFWIYIFDYNSISKIYRAIPDG